MYERATQPGRPFDLYGGYTSTIMVYNLDNRQVL
jgi:hypothetical protein